MRRTYLANTPPIPWLRRAVLSALGPLVVSLTGIGLAPPASAVEVVDQQNLVFAGGSNYKLFSLAQSFTPTFTSLAFVDAGLSCCGSVDPGPVLLRVDIRDGGPVGPVIGSSSAVSVPDGTDEALIQFELSPPIALTPGGTYVIELVHLSGGADLWAWGSVFDVYPGGKDFVNGTAGGTDFVFRTGVFSDEPPQLGSASVPVEYSNDFDERAVPGGGGQGPGDPGQVLYTEPPDGASDSLPADVTDFVPGIESGNEPDAQVDALAYGFDFLYSDVVADAADLVVSFEGDVILGGGPSEVAALLEDTSGGTAILYTHGDLDVSDADGVLEDVDGLELWGPVGQGDALYYSLAGDALSGTSIYLDNGGTPGIFVSHATIVAAVTTLGYTGDAADVDVDALMVRNVGSRVEFELGDEILFSIRAIPQANFDGGEIIRLPSGGAPTFLVHGSHVWDTGFGAAAAFGSASEDVDAIEANPSPAAVPALGRWSTAALGLLLAALAVLAARSERLSTGRASERRAACEPSAEFGPNEPVI